MKFSDHLVLSILFFSALISCNQKRSSPKNQRVQMIERIDIVPTEMTFRNELPVNNSGGHLQGIQFLEYNQNKYYVLSGSSDSYSYYSMVKLGKENMVLSMNKILEIPFKHAGGFQIYKDLMAIGIEDNEAKDVSKVFIYKIENPVTPPQKPLAIIERKGAEKRTTAGCVAITQIDGKVVVAVGDWDTAHLDFYRMDYDKLGLEGSVFSMDYSIDCQKQNRTGWADESWLSYQSINFIQSSSGQHYLAGMTSNDAEENILDLFEVEVEKPFAPKLKKVFSKNFGINTQAKFRWGSGVHLDDNDRLKVFSCGENILDVSAIHIYE